MQTASPIQDDLGQHAMRWRIPSPRKLAWLALAAGAALAMLSAGAAWWWAVPWLPGQFEGLATALLLAGLFGSALMAALLGTLSRGLRRSLAAAEGIAHRLGDSQARLAEAQRLGRMGSWSYNFDSARVDCSEEARHLIGLDASRADASIKACLRQVHRADRSRFMLALKAAARCARGFEIELRTRDGAGPPRWLQLAGFAMVDESGNLCLLSGTVMDVTERQRSEQRRSVEHKVARRLAEADTLAELTPRIIKAACLIMGWDCGVRWSADAGRGSLTCHEGWSRESPAAQALLASARSGALERPSRDMLRQVIETGYAVCFPLLESTQASGALSSYALAIAFNGKATGLVQFFSHEPCDADEALLAVLRGIGIQIGQFCRRKDAEEARRDSEARLHGIVHLASEAIIALDHELKIVLFNPAAQTMFGCSEVSAMGNGIDRFIPGRLQQVQAGQIEPLAAGALAAPTPGAAREALGLRADGEEFPLEASVAKLTHAGQPMYSVILSDITTRQRDQKQLKFLANYDQLTSLPNRFLFGQRLERALVHAQRFNKGLAVLFIDLDRFKIINDTLGHAAGDGVLNAVAARLMGNMREIDTVARLGGDEFAVLIEQLTDVRQVGVIAQKLIRAFAESIVVDGREYHVSASIGVSTYPADGGDGATLLKNADIAMYRAKDRGKNNAQFYAAGMNAHTVQRLSLESGMRQALQRQEFLLHYQPKVDLVSGRVTGMEALVRWQRPESGMVSPADFIPLAEETGLIVPIGEWVLRAACEYTQAWLRQGGQPLKVAVNLSARQFAQTSLISDVARVLDETGLDPRALDLEITESMVMGNPEQAIQTLRRLKSMGMTLSIDDFGTGYSSLGYLKRFPIDNVKIDRSFIKDIPGNSDDATITRTIIAMGHNLRLKVVAEGVETQAQLDFLSEHGCDEMQGYHFSRPLAGPDFAVLLRSLEPEAALSA